jgi:hypothetical protein
MERTSDSPQPTRRRVELYLQRLLVAGKHLLLGRRIESQKERDRSFLGLSGQSPTSFRHRV